MDATFRTRRSNIDVILFALGLPVFLVVAAAGACMVCIAANVSGVLIGLLGISFGLLMTIQVVWELLADQRNALTIRRDRLVFRRISQVVEIDLQDVTEARWLSGARGLILRTSPMLRLKRRLLGIGGGVLRPSVVKIILLFDKYETHDSGNLVRYFHAALPPEVQRGWNLFSFKFAYDFATGVPKPRPCKPGPGEILFRRNRWDRWFLPSALVVFLVGALDWEIVADARFLLPTLALLGTWIVMRATTPAEGMIVRRLSHAFDPDRIPVLVFAWLWTIAVWVAFLLFNRWRPNQGGLAPMIFAFVIWYTVLGVEIGPMDRRIRQRDRERADLAAKACGEAASDPSETV